MFKIGRPSDAQLDDLVVAQSSKNVTYAEVGATRGTAPDGYHSDRYVAELGTGHEVFTRACAGIREWVAQRGADVRVRPDRPPIEVGTTVAQCVTLPLVSAIACCRIVYVVDEDDAFGFAYGTLPAHPEQGEESFVVERDDHGRVRFVITAFSRPRQLAARLGAPVSRRMQIKVSNRYLDGMRAYVDAR